MNKTAYFSISKDVTYGMEYIDSLHYPIVWVTKYRKPILIDDMESDSREYLLETLKSLDRIPIAMERMPD